MDPLSQDVTPRAEVLTLEACRQCRLCEGRKRVVDGIFPERAPIMIIGDSPGKHEFAAFEDETAALLGRYLEAAGIKSSDCSSVSMVRCRIPGGRAPLADEIAACSGWLRADLLKHRPRTVIAMGAAAISFFVGKDPHEIHIGYVRGEVREWIHPEDETLRIDVLFTAHPSHVLQEERNAESNWPTLFGADLCGARAITFAESGSIPADTGKRERKPFMPGTKFTGGWHLGAQIHLISRGANGERIVHRDAAEHYFLIRAEDLTPTARERLSSVIGSGIRDRKGALMRVRHIAPDPEIPEWIRVYPEIPSHWVSKDLKRGMTDQEARRFVSVSPILRMAQMFESVGVRTFEADVDPLRRFLTDRALEIEADGLRVLWLDIETDDEAMPGVPVSQVIGRVPILCVGAIDHARNERYAVAQSTAKHHERDLLAWVFQELLPEHDVVCAWNGEEFDFPFMLERARLLGVPIAPQTIAWRDSMLAFKKHHKYGGGETASYALDKVSHSILGVGKEKREHSIKWLFMNDREKLRSYNLVDVHRMLEIEEKTGYVAAELSQNAASNNFPGNTYVGLRVDGLVLNEGFSRGTHFPTKHFNRETEEGKFTGAFVLEPVLGRHGLVANLDFSSLYPSVFTTWNISPDTFVPDREVSAHTPESLARCPRIDVGEGKLAGGAHFKKGPVGIIPTIYGLIASKREFYKKKMKAASPLSPEWMQLKRLEYAWKSLGLSFYGTMGSHYARIYNRRMAEAITVSAQFLTRCTLELARRLGYEPLAADTDSCFIGIKEESVDVPRFLAQAAILYDQIVRQFNCPTNVLLLEHEQTFASIIFFAKKRYIGRLLTQKGKPVPPDAPLEIKGLEVRRSDGVAVAKKFQERVIHLLISNGSIDEVRACAISMRDRVFGGQMTVDELSLSATLSRAPSGYKKPPGHAKLAERLMAEGHEIYVGQRLSWIILDASESPQKIVAVHEFVGNYDAHHYWNEAIWPPVERLLEVVWPSEDWGLWKVARARKVRAKLKGDEPLGESPTKRGMKKRASKKKKPEK